jgi:hypothetical protein
MLRSAKRITPREILIQTTGKETKAPERRMSKDPSRCGGIRSEAYHLVTQGVEGRMKNDAKSAAAEPCVVRGGKDIRRSESASTVVREMEQNWKIENGVQLDLLE